MMVNNDLHCFNGMICFLFLTQKRVYGKLSVKEKIQIYALYDQYNLETQTLSRIV
jgi:hypothetical protein